MSHNALLLFGTTDFASAGFSGDLLWRSGFRAPDPFFLVEIDGKTHLLTSPLEYGRAVKEARVDEVVLLDPYVNRSGRKGSTAGVSLFLKEHGVSRLRVPGSFPLALAEKLKGDFELAAAEGSLYPKRRGKTAWEVEEIIKAQRAVEKALNAARAFLAASRIESDTIIAEGKPLTSETLRAVIDRTLYNLGYLGFGTIVAGGAQAADPHCAGSGPLPARTPIVVDVFPLSFKTHYYADHTRTLFKGEPSSGFKKMYEAVRRAQELGLEQVRHGAPGRAIQESVKQFFDDEGYPTSFSGDLPEGFIHGVGHGVGIEIHEHPRISSVDDVLEEGDVVTVEPGLYYPRSKEFIPAGGVRIEDIVVVEKGGCWDISTTPKGLDWAVVE
jgi:Xaa-Pro aminopeptidase